MKKMVSKQLVAELSEVLDDLYKYIMAARVSVADERKFLRALGRMECALRLGVDLFDDGKLGVIFARRICRLMDELERAPTSDRRPRDLIQLMDELDDFVHDKLALHILEEGES